MAGVFLVSILQAGDWARFSTPARPLQIGISIQGSVLPWASVSSLMGNCQILTYIKSCKYICWDLALSNTEEKVTQLSVLY